MRALALLTLGLLATSTGCSSCRGGAGGAGGAGGRAKVAVSIFPVYDLVRRVAGPDADVVLLLPPGKSEHHFDPTPKQVEDVARAKLGVMVGLGLDPWMERLVHDAAPSARLLKVGDRVPTIPVKADAIGADDQKTADDDEHAGAIDPHCWLDPSRARLMAKAIGEELARADAPHANAYRQRAADLDAQLAALDAEIDARTATWKKRDFVTFHGSFGYYADRYHLTIDAVIEPLPGSTPTGAYIDAVRAEVQKHHVATLFREPQLDPRPAQILADDLKISVGVLDPVGGGPETDSYEKLLRFDTDALEKVLK